MSPFGAYARYYDLLYRDKDYAAEARFVQELLERHAPGARTILDLGCGTGLHAIELATLGYVVHGIDRSPEMLALAERRRAGLPPWLRDRLAFSCGELRDLALGRSFDAVLALFHVMSYQTSDDALLAAMATARAHLRPDGVFLFDYWHGAAVLKEGPQARTKQVEDDAVIVTRKAEPVWDEASHLIEVRYHLAVQEKETGMLTESMENHTLRYLFPGEISRLLASRGFETVISCAWMTSMTPGPDSWSAYTVAKPRGDLERGPRRR